MLLILTGMDLKISKIARLDEDELTQQVMTVSSKHDDLDQNFQPGKILMSAIQVQ